MSITPLFAMRFRYDIPCIYEIEQHWIFQCSPITPFPKFHKIPPYVVYKMTVLYDFYCFF